MKNRMKNNNIDDWKEAMKKFSSISDGFCVLGFDKANKRKFVFGLNKDAATRDGLFIIQHAALEWMGTEIENIQTDDEN